MMTSGSESTVVLDIEGMTCSSCVSRVEKSLTQLPGVSAAVNLATNTARVDFPATISTEDLLVAVAKTGYTAHVPVSVSKRDAHEHDHSAPAGSAPLAVRLIVSVILTLPIVAMAMVPAWQFDYWQWVSLVLATPVVFWAGWLFHRATFINLRHGTLTMDTLITLGTFAAFGWSVFALFFGMAGHIGMRHGLELFAWQQDPTGNIYFEAAAGVTTFLLLGRYLEDRSKRSAGAALRALAALGAYEVSVMRNGVESRIPIEELNVGDVFVVRPGDVIATDGTVIEGSTAVDESALTGESIPVEVQANSAVTGATIALDGRLLVMATRVGQNTRIAQLAKLVEDAQLHKAGVQRLADKISAIFVPIVIVIAFATLAGWLLLGQPLAGGFTAAVAVLVIACPCALGLATPVALLVGTGRAAQMGIIISGPEAIESSSRIDTVVLDKTGTVTSGLMSVAEIRVSVGTDESEAIQRVGALERLSEHPVAKAIARETDRQNVTNSSLVVDFRSTAGVGVYGKVGGIDVWAGTVEWMERNDLLLSADQRQFIASTHSAGGTAILAGWNSCVRAIFAVTDTVRDDSVAAISRLNAMGLQTILLTGDHEGVARTVADHVGISRVIAGASPERKVAVIQELMADGRHVAMVGDGVNDAAALAQADLGLAMGTGTDVAIAASDITLVRGTLSAAADALSLSRRTLGIIRGNLFWAFAYNVAAIPLAALGFLNPMLAGAAMAFSSLFVVLNSLRLKSFR
ncbi:heavy metal translocating P-type ATPase [Alpinimonas psychrophila]|uniref:Cation-transporting P-type ATPase B n=1 Tax=Alpinimonas psychrophila TaxID=748908 RepID=A0A7W3JSC4_9MICO|nr:heavy metal translocating P-type ATPase [Alpinimonas psychrophila]MBA8828232.1 Cu+-exporting ATPase [Alpinimonas psychrophila]